MSTLEESLKRDFEAAKQTRGVTASMICGALGHSPTSSWLYELFKGRGDWHWDYIDSWYSLTGARELMKHLGQMTKHVVFPLADSKGTASTVKEFGEYLVALGQESGQKPLTRERFAEIEREGLEAMGAIWAELEALREQVEDVQHRPVVPGAEKF